MEETETVASPQEATKEKAPCLETIYKRIKECNGTVMALFYDLEYITRTSPPKEGDANSDEPKIGTTPNLTDPWEYLEDPQ